MIYETENCSWEYMKEWILKTPNLAEIFLKKHVSPVYLYGGGKACYWYLKYLKSNRIEIKGIIETDKRRIGKFIQGYPVISLDEVLEKNNNYSILISAPKFLDEISALLTNKCNTDYIFSFEGEIYYTFIKDIEGYRKFIIKNWGRIEKIRDSLFDELSKYTLKSFLQGRISGNQRYFIDCMVPNQYYPLDIFSFTDSETLVECGSNNGDTLDEFLRIVNKKFDACYLFEPDKNCISILKKRIYDEWKSDRIHLIERCAWDCNTELSFDVNSEWGASHILDQESEIKVIATTIDECINVPVSFIKMDIEGAEIRALIGAEETIKKNKPKLAICVYHEMGDFLDIPEWLHNLVPEYKFYLRHHNWGATETVLYAYI